MTMSQSQEELREQVARVIDPDAMSWKKPWLERSGFFTDPANGPFRDAALQREKDAERSEMMLRKANALTKADAIIELLDLEGLRKALEPFAQTLTIFSSDLDEGDDEEIEVYATRRDVKRVHALLGTDHVTGEPLALYPLGGGGEHE